MKQTRFISAAMAATICLGVSVWAQSGHANALSSQEQKEGWILLFDGKSLDKWNVTPALAKVWKVSDGAIKADLSDAGGTMLTKDTFDNFVLKVEVPRASGHQFGHHPAQPATSTGAGARRETDARSRRPWLRAANPRQEPRQLQQR